MGWNLLVQTRLRHGPLSLKNPRGYVLMLTTATPYKHHTRHSREGGNPGFIKPFWTPAFAGVTDRSVKKHVLGCLEYLAGNIIVAVDMLHFKPPILLHIEALVFNLPPVSSPIVGHFDGTGPADLKIGDPLESSGLDLPASIRLGFKALENAQRMFSILRVDIGDVAHPSVFLIDFGILPRSVPEVVFRMELQESLEPALEGGEVILCWKIYMAVQFE